MIITCPSCATSYQVSLGAIADTGRKVKCAKCGHRWLVYSEDTAASSGSGIGAAPQTVPQDMEHEHTAAPAGNDEAASFDQEDIVFAPSDAKSDAPAAPASPPGNDYDEDDIEALFNAGAGQGAGSDVESLAAVIGEEDGDAGQPPRGRLALLARRILRKERQRADSAGSGQDSPQDAADTGGMGKAAMARVLRYGAMAACVLVMLGASILFRHFVVATLPGTARLYAAAGMPVNLRGLEFRNVTFERTFENGLPVLAIHGEVVNITARTLPIPEIRYGLKDRAQNEIYSWTGPVQAQTLEPEKAAMFITRLQSPPSEAVRADLRFAGPRGGRS